jgi:translation initiation factor IF-3
MEEEEEEEEEEPAEKEMLAADTVKTAADVNAASRQNLDAESEEGMEEEEEEGAPVKQRAAPVYAATTPPVPRAYSARAKVAAEVRRLGKVNVDQATAEARHEKATMRKVAASAKVAEASVSRQNAHAGVKLSQKAAPKPVAPKPVAPKPVAKPVAPKPVAPKPVAPKPVAKPVAKAAPNGQHLAGTPTNPPHGISRVNPSQ